MSSPLGWIADPADLRVQRYWNGSVWTAQRVWNGAQWVDTPLGPTGPVTPELTVPKRGHRGWWIGSGALAAVALVVVIVAIGANSGSHASFCNDLKSASGTFKATSFEGNGLILDSNLSPAEQSRYRAAESTATDLAARAPAGVKGDLTAVAHDYRLALAGNSTDQPEPFTAATLAITEWTAENCN